MKKYSKSIQIIIASLIFNFSFLNFYLPAQIIYADAGESNNNAGDSKIAFLNNAAPPRYNFHEMGDEDWIQFYGLAGQSYKITVNNVSPRCDAVIEIYDSDGTTLLISADNNGYGQDDYADLDPCPHDGIYYAKLRQNTSEIYGQDTEYDVNVLMLKAPVTSFIQGVVKDRYSGKPIGMVRIKTDGNGSAFSFADSGGYLMIHSAGIYTLTAETDNYKKWTDSVTVPEAGTIIRDISMIPDGKGDINEDGLVDLNDAVLCLKIMAGMNLSVNLKADVNGDNKTGLEEIIYILQRISLLR